MNLDPLQDGRLVAIVRLDDLSDAGHLVDALLRAGVRCVEFTLTNSEAPSVVSRLRNQFTQFSSGQALIGLGSVRSEAEVDIAVEGHAQFIVTPIMSTSIIERCVRNKVPVIAGAFTPTEIATAWEAGATAVKVFPARTLGPGYIKDVLAPMPYLRMVPTGGIDLGNVSKYLESGAYAVGIGGQLIDPILVQNQDWAAISAKAVQYVDACKA